MTRRTQQYLAAAIVTFLAATAAACSDDSSDGSKDGSTTSASTSASNGGSGTPSSAPETTTSTVPARGDTVSAPTITGPISGGKYDLPFNPMPKRIIDEFDYVQEEYFIQGTATAYTAAGQLKSNGRWRAEPGPTAPFTTRILVRKPADAADASGLVTVEWLNVTSGMDSDPDFGFLHPLLLARGDVWVGVSAQPVGVQGGGFEIPIEGFDAQPLKEWDPQRYASLEHPGDDYSYDIFSQAGQAVLRPDGATPLDGIAVERVIAMGESQSAARLVTYVNAIHPAADLFDAFFVHSRGGTGSKLNTTIASMPAPSFIRADIADPVLQFQTETDIFGLTFFPARQADTDLLRTWEVAGTAHADQSTLDYGFESGREWNTTTVLDFESMCGGPLNQGPQAPVARAAFRALIDWLETGAAPESQPTIDVTDANSINRDASGLALGGIRTPAVDVPISTLSGDTRPDASVICSLFGFTTPFSADELARRYPTHDDYVAQVTTNADLAVTAGVLLPEDRDAVVAAAEGAPVPS